MDVRKSPSMLEVERREGVALEQAIARAINETGSTAGAAERLGIKLNTLYSWTRYLRIQIKTVAEAPKAAA